MSIKLKTINSDMIFLGTSVFGVQLMRVKDKILVYPRLCPHEGACLDNSRKTKEVLICPWHGRQISPYIIYDIGSENIIYDATNKMYSMKVENGVMEIIIRPELNLSMDRP